jgi:hypothetical protein
MYTPLLQADEFIARKNLILELSKEISLLCIDKMPYLDLIYA